MTKLKYNPHKDSRGTPKFHRKKYILSIYSDGQLRSYVWHMLYKWGLIGTIKEVVNAYIDYLINQNKYDKIKHDWKEFFHELRKERKK